MISPLPAATATNGNYHYLHQQAPLPPPLPLPPPTASTVCDIFTVASNNILIWPCDHQYTSPPHQHRVWTAFFMEVWTLLHEHNISKWFVQGEADCYFCLHVLVHACVTNDVLQDMPKALMSCMGMTPDVVHHTFIARLNSDVERPALKVALLELVTSCIEHQPALADAFLNVHYPAKSNRMFQKKQKKEHEEGGCLLFVCSVLSNTEEVMKHTLHIFIYPTIWWLYVRWPPFTIVSFQKSTCTQVECSACSVHAEHSTRVQGNSWALRWWF